MKIKLIDYGLKNKPKRAHYNDAGADVYLNKNVILEAHETKKIPLGFGVVIPDGIVGFIITRSSTAAKGLLVHIPPIDSGYRGEIHAVVTNTNSYEITLTEGDRVGQLVLLPCILADFIDDLGEERGNGAFGSTGK